MKKIICIILSLSMLCCFAACTTKSSKESAAYDKIIENYPANGKNGTLKVAISPDFAPMEFYDLAKKGDDAIVGFDVILAKYIATELDMTLEIKPMSFDACQAAVETGNVDMSISGFSYTADRAEHFEMSDYYYAGDNETQQTIIVLKENEGKFTKLEDFAGKKIGYQGASLQEQLVKDNFSNISDVDISYVYSDLGTAVEALKSKKIDGLAVAYGNGEAIISNAKEVLSFSGFEFEVSEESENNLCLIQKGNVELLNKVNAALKKAYDNKLYGDWYDACKVYSGVSTLDELGFDAEGNKIKE